MIHYHFWHPATHTKYDGWQRNSGSINFTYWCVFLCTRYNATALFSTQSMSLRTHHKNQYSQHLNRTNCNTKPAGPQLIDFAVTDDIYILMWRGAVFIWISYPKWGRVRSSDYFYENRRYTGLLTPPSTWRIPIEKARQCTAINFGIVRRVCGVLLSGGADNWSIWDGIEGEESTYYNFPLLLHWYWCIILVDVPERYICIDTNM